VPICNTWQAKDAQHGQGLMRVYLASRPHAASVSPYCLQLTATPAPMLLSLLQRRHAVRRSAVVRRPQARHLYPVHAPVSHHLASRACGAALRQSSRPNRSSFTAVGPHAGGANSRLRQAMHDFLTKPVGIFPKCLWQDRALPIKAQHHRSSLLRCCDTWVPAGKS